jgi:hypothetical protein
MKPNDPIIKALAIDLVYAYGELRGGSTSRYKDLARAHVEALTGALIIVARGGDDASDAVDRRTAANGLKNALEDEWDAGNQTYAALEKAVLDRLQVITGTDEPAPADEEISNEEYGRELRLNIARPLIHKFATAAYRWLGPDSTDMSRFAAEQRADVLADMLLMVVPDYVHIDPMRTAQDVRNDLKSRGLTFSPKDVMDRLYKALA